MEAILYESSVVREGRLEWRVSAALAAMFGRGINVHWQMSPMNLYLIRSAPIVKYT